MKTECSLFFFLCFISQIHQYQSWKVRHFLPSLFSILGLEHTPMPDHTFRCRVLDDKIGEYFEYFYKNEFCDGNTRCIDGRDEKLGCKREGNYTCGQGRFACDGDQCKDINVQCNTIKDCLDGTDELNCGDEINVKNCTSEDKFLCKDGLRCVDLEYTCDHECNCFDCSDEKENCTKHDEELLNKCPHAYFITAKGPRCFCETNDTSSNTSCNSIQNCDRSQDNFIRRVGEEWHCDQRCIQLKAKKQCTCYEGYYPVNGTFGSQCITKDAIVILYTNEVEIKSLNNTSLKSSTILNGISNCTLLTAANNYVYYVTLSRDNKGIIFKKSLNSGEPEKLIETEFAITSIDVDYLTNNVYFTSNGSLSVCSSDGRICTQLKCCSVNSVTLAPKSGWMFYTQMETQKSYCRNRYFLARSNMDGSNETIRESGCYKGEISIEVDESKNMMYMLQRSNKIGNFFRQISLESAFEQEDTNSNIFMFFADDMQRFTFYNNGIFFTRGLGHDIFYVESIKHESPVIYLRDNGTSGILDVHVYNRAIQLSSENPCNKSSCSGLCLVKPEVHSSGQILSHSCLCDGFKPTNSNHWCSSDSAQADNRKTVWIITGILVLIISIAVLIILGITLHRILMKSNWHGYYVTFRGWVGSKSDQSIILKDQK